MTRHKSSATAVAASPETTVTDASYGVAPKGSSEAHEPVLVVARFPTVAAAAHEYQTLYDEQVAGKTNVDGIVVVSADDKGKVRVEKLVEHSTKQGFSLGLVAAIVAGAFFPATMLAGGIAFTVGGAAAGKARNAAKRHGIDRALEEVVKPGTAGLVCLADTLRAPRLKRKIRGAQEIRTIRIDADTAAALKAAKPAG